MDGFGRNQGFSLGAASLVRGVRRSARPGSGSGSGAPPPPLTAVAAASAPHAPQHAGGGGGVHATGSFGGHHSHAVGATGAAHGGPPAGTSGGNSMPAKTGRQPPLPSYLLPTGAVDTRHVVGGTHAGASGLAAGMLSLRLGTTASSTSWNRSHVTDASSLLSGAPHVAHASAPVDAEREASNAMSCLQASAPDVLMCAPAGTLQRLLAAGVGHKRPASMPAADLARATLRTATHDAEGDEELRRIDALNSLQQGGQVLQACLERMWEADAHASASKAASSKGAGAPKAPQLLRLRSGGGGSGSGGGGGGGGGQGAGDASGDLGRTPTALRLGAGAGAGTVDDAAGTTAGTTSSAANADGTLGSALAGGTHGAPAHGVMDGGPPPEALPELAYFDTGLEVSDDLQNIFGMGSAAAATKEPTVHTAADVYHPIALDTGVISTSVVGDVDALPDAAAATHVAGSLVQVQHWGEAAASSNSIAALGGRAQAVKPAASGAPGLLAPALPQAIHDAIVALGGGVSEVTSSRLSTASEGISSSTDGTTAADARAVAYAARDWVSQVVIDSDAFVLHTLFGVPVAAMHILSRSAAARAAEAPSMARSGAAPQQSASIESLSLQALFAGPAHGVRARDVMYGANLRALEARDASTGGTPSDALNDVQHSEPAIARLLNGLAQNDVRPLMVLMPGLCYRYGRSVLLQRLQKHGGVIHMVRPPPARGIGHTSAGRAMNTAGAAVGAAVGAAAGADMHLQSGAVAGARTATHEAAPPASRSSILALSSAPVRVQSGFRVKSERDLSCRSGKFVVLEYVEQHPPLLTSFGMGARFVTYKHPSGAESRLTDRMVGDEMRSEGDDEVDAGGDAVDGVKPQVVLVDEKGSQFPMLGKPPTAEEPIRSIQTALFNAPVFVHQSKPTDFLLVLTHEHGQPGVVDELRAGRAHGTGSKSKSVTARAAHAAARSHGSGGASAVSGRATAYLREIPRVYVVGQVEPRERVFKPSVEQRDTLDCWGALGKEATQFLQKLFRYTLLLLFRRVDTFSREAHRDSHAARAAGSELAAREHAAGEAAGPLVRPVGAIVDESSGRVLQNQLRLSEVLQHMRQFVGEATDARLIACFDEVADVDKERNIIECKKQVPTPADYRMQKGLTLEQLCLFESFLFSRSLLQHAGVTNILMDDKKIQDALAALLLMQAKKTKLDKSDVMQGVRSSVDAEVEQHVAELMNDGFMQTVEGAQKLLRYVQRSPWAVTENYISYKVDNNTNAIALGDDAGDPSGCGEGFSFIRGLPRHCLSAMSARTSSDKLEGTEYDLRSWTILQMVEFLKERGVINSAHDLRRSLEKPRWQLLNLVRNVIHESRTKDMQHYADVRINAAERAAKKATQANEIQAQQRKALSKTEVSRMTEMESLLSESELDAAFHRIEQERNAKNAEAAENNEAAVRRVLEGYGVRRTVEGAGAAVTNVVSGDKYRLPLPTALQQPPRVNLASSSGTKEADATLAALSDPPLPPVFQRTPDGGYKSRGKILRVVRTTVDKEGQQVVYVTYSVNPYLLKQVWLKQHFGVDLGLLRFPFKPGHRKTVTPFDNVLDPDRTGLVATGIFPSPIASMFMQKQAEMQRTILRKHVNSTKFNMWGIGVGNARSSITIHGTEVPACSRCKLWGHASGKASMCPVPAQGDKTASGMPSYDADADFPAAHGLFVSTDGEVSAAAAHRHAIADDAEGADGSALGAGAASAAALKSQTIPRHRREVPALRTLCNRLEEAVLLCLVNVSYKDLWEPVDRAAFPQYYAVIARPMDLSTLRRNILNREYVTYNMFDKDLQLLHSNAVQFNGEHHSIARCAKKAVQVIRSFLAEERKQRERDARDCSVQYKIACARAPEVLKWLRLGFGLPQEAVAATASATVEASALLPAATSANAVFSTPSSMAAGAPLPHVQPTVLQGGVGMGEEEEEEEEEEVVMTSHAVPFAAQALTPAPNAVMERSGHGEGMEEDEEEIVLGGGGGVPAVATAHPMFDDDAEEEEIVLTEQQVRLPTSHTSGAVSVAAGGHQDDGVGDDDEEEEIVLTHGNV